MSSRRSKKTFLQLEALEQREVLSHGMLGLASGVVHDSALVHVARLRVQRFAGAARGTLVTTTTEPDGSIQAVYNISGGASLIGAFTGQLTSTVSANHRTVTATATLKAANSSQISLSLAGAFGRLTANPRFSGGFAITGGTGIFAHLHGGGTVSGNVNSMTAAITLQFSGKVTTT